MNNLSSYCGLVDARITASDKDLPVLKNVPSPLRILCKVTQKRLHVIVKKKWTFLALFSFLPATASKLSPYFVGQNIILLTKWLFTKKKVSQTTVILPYFFQLFFASYFCCCVTSLYLQKYKHKVNSKDQKIVL